MFSVRSDDRLSCRYAREYCRESKIEASLWTRREKRL